MAAKVKIISDPVKNNEGDSVTIQVEAWDDVDIPTPIPMQIVAPFDWFDNKQKFMINLRSYIESELQRYRNQQAKRNKVDVGIQIIKDNAGVEIDLSTIDLGGIAGVI